MLLLWQSSLPFWRGMYAVYNANSGQHIHQMMIQVEDVEVKEQHSCALWRVIIVVI